MDITFQLTPDAYYYTTLVHPSGFCVAANSSGNLTVWDGSQTTVLQGHTQTITSLIALDATRFASASNDCTIRIWARTACPASSFSCTQTLANHDSWLCGLVLLTDESLVSATALRTLFLWSGGSSYELVSQTATGSRGWIQMLTALPGARVAVASMDQKAEIWHPASGTRLQTLEGHTGNVFSFTLLEDGRYATGSADRTVRIWDPTTCTTLHVLQKHLQGVPLRLYTLPGGQLAASGEDEVAVWDLTKETMPRTSYCVGARSCIVLPDGELVGCGLDGTLRVWGPDHTTALAGGHRSSILQAGLLADGRLLSVSSDGKVCVWRGLWTAAARALARCRALKEKLMERVWDPERAGAEWLILRELDD